MNIVIFVQPPLLLAIVILSPSPIAARNHFVSQVSKQFRRRTPQTNVTFNVKLKTPSSSALPCSIRCARSSTCRAFCHSRIPPSCYLAQQSASPVQLLSDHTGLDCFNRECPGSDGYNLVGGRCVKMFVEKKTYLTAGEKCAQNGAHLYHFSSREVDKHVVSQFLRTNGLVRCWVGADDLAVHGSYVWSDGTPLPNDSPLWDPGEPSFKDNNGQEERCVGVFDRQTLNDFTCHYLMSFICQIDV